MIGAIIGDIVGSRFQFVDYKSKDFDFFHDGCQATDDTFMTLAIGKAFAACADLTDLNTLQTLTILYMKEIARAHRDTGWGANFYKWLFEKSVPYNSCGNGAGMRVSPVGWIASTEEEVRTFSKAVTEISHNHPEGLKGAECVAMAVFLARNGASKEEIKARLTRDYYPELATMTLDKIRPTYCIDEYGSWVTCQGSIPQAMTAFFESENFEDAVRGAISIGGDADTIGCMTGAVAGAYYGVPQEMEARALSYLSTDLRLAYFAFEGLLRRRGIERK
jgi:type I restriction enzyme M protein